jgi:hypothetical protein
MPKKKEIEDLSEFIPELVKVGVVGAMNIMAKLMKHCIKNLMEWKEIQIPVWSPKPQLHMHPASYI